MDTAQPQPHELHLGGWREVPVTSDHTALLIKALSQRRNYASSISKPVCIKDVYRVRQQVVSGMKYIFEANACAIDFPAEGTNTLPGACTGHDSGCRAAPFEIQVYSQPWTNTLEVQAINWLD